MNKLEQIMNKQEELQRRLDTDFSKLDAKERAQFMKDHYVYLNQELQEALYEMPFFKAWKDYSNLPIESHDAAWKKVQMELVDSLHFFVNLLLCAGMSADDIYNMYMAKNAENHRRQDEGYTADKSYKDQSVEEVMNAIADEEVAPTCMVHMKDDKYGSNNFVAVINDIDDSSSIYYNTDILSLGFAAKLVTETFYSELNKLPAEERLNIEGILFGGVKDE